MGTLLDPHILDFATRRMVAVATSYRGYKSPKKVHGVTTSAQIKSNSGYSSATKGWPSRLLRSASVKAKELLQNQLPTGGKIIKSMGYKLLEMAKKGLNEARKALADGTLEASYSKREGRPKSIVVAKKSSISGDGKKLIAAIDKLYKTEKQVKKETERNTRINARSAHTPVAQPLLPPVEPLSELRETVNTVKCEDPKQLSLHHPDKLRISVPDFPVEPQASQAPQASKAPGPIPRKSLLFGAKDLQSVKLKGVLKGTGSGAKRRVSFGENNFKTIPPRPSPVRTNSAQTLLGKSLPFTADNLQQVKLRAESESSPSCL